MINISAEIKFNTARSGGKGGQSVNKVESMVEGYWKVDDSALLSDEEKSRIKSSLAKKINSEGFLQVKSQVSRTQLGNKDLVLKKMHDLINKALVVKKKRKPTKPSKQSKIKRLESKKKASEIKQARKKPAVNE